MKKLQLKITLEEWENLRYASELWGYTMTMVAVQGLVQRTRELIADRQPGTYFNGSAYSIKFANKVEVISEKSKEC
jgi:hypothetical protein